MIRRPPRSTHCISSAASDVYKRQILLENQSVPSKNYSHSSYWISFFFRTTGPISNKLDTKCHLKHFVQVYSNAWLCYFPKESNCDIMKIRWKLSKTLSWRIARVMIQLSCVIVWYKIFVMSFFTNEIPYFFFQTNKFNHNFSQSCLFLENDFIFKTLKSTQRWFTWWAKSKFN